MNKHLGSSIDIHCPLTSSWNEKKYNIVHFSTLTDEYELVAQAPRYTKIITNLNDAGRYCCFDPFIDNVTLSGTPESCMSITSKILILEYIYIAMYDCPCVYL